MDIKIKADDSRKLTVTSYHGGVIFCIGHCHCCGFNKNSIPINIEDLKILIQELQNEVDIISEIEKESGNSNKN